MGKVHRDVAVPIPAGAVTYRNGLVFDPLHGDKELMLIGYAVSDSEMNPNQNYFQFHREEWLQFNPTGQARVRPDTLEAGLYAGLLGAAQKTGLLDALYEAYGFPDGNAILDCGMAALRGDPPESLGDSVTFHGPILGEAWYADFFQAPDTAAKAQKVLEGWVQRCRSKGLTGVYLGVSNAPMPGAIWAVAADGAAAGLPVMCFPQADGAVWTAVQWFAAYGVQVRGILWEEGTQRQDGPIPWAQVLHRSGEAFAFLLEQAGRAVREDIHCMLESGLFGTAGACTLADGTSHEAVLLYRPVDGAMAGTELLEQVQTALQRLQAQIKAGESPVIPEGLAPYLAVDSDSGGLQVQVREEALQAAYRRQGYTGLAVSAGVSPREAAVLLRARETAEQALAAAPKGNPSAGGVELAWILGILEAVMEKACSARGLAWKEVLPVLRQVQYHLGGRTYRCGEEIPAPAAAVLGALDITLEMLQDFAQEVSRRYLQSSGTLNRVYRNRLPWKLSQSEEGQASEKKSGSGKTAAREKSQAEEKKGGRPRGKKDSYQRVRSTREQMEQRRQNTPPDKAQ